MIATSAPDIPETLTSAPEMRYRDFLRNDNGLAENSLHAYLPLVADLMGYLKRQNGGIPIRQLDAGVLRDFLLDRTQRRSSAFARLLTSSLRSFLRFCTGRVKSATI